MRKVAEVSKRSIDRINNIFNQDEQAEALLELFSEALDAPIEWLRYFHLQQNFAKVQMDGCCKVGDIYMVYSWDNRKEYYLLAGENHYRMGEPILWGAPGEKYFDAYVLSLTLTSRNT